MNGVCSFKAQKLVQRVKNSEWWMISSDNMKHAEASSLKHLNNIEIFQIRGML